VADALAQQVTAPLDTTLAKWVETFERERRGPDPARRLRRLERELAALSQRLQRAEDAFLRGVFTVDELTAARERLSAERRQLEGEIQECARAADRQPPDAVVAALTTELRRPASAIRHAGSVAERRELISRYVQRIEVGPEQHVVMRWAEDGERPPG